MLDPQALLDSSARNASVPLIPFACFWTNDGDDAAWVCLAGEFDIATSPQLDRALRGAQREAHLVVADLRRVLFVDSSAIHAIVDANDRAQSEGGRLVVLRGPPSVDRMFGLSRACDEVEVVDLDADESPAMAQLRLLAEERDMRSADVDHRLRRTG